MTEVSIAMEKIDRLFTTTLGRAVALAGVSY